MSARESELERTAKAIVRAQARNRTSTTRWSRETIVFVAGIDSEVARAMRAAHRRALLDLVRDNPAMTLADLLELTKGRHAEVLKGLTVGDLLSANSDRPTSRQAPGPVSTRTPSERANFEQAILSTLDVAREWMTAPEIRASVGGTPAQARAALNRLIAAGKVVYEGQARGTRYRSAG
jgi:hypothetical protein